MTDLKELFNRFCHHISVNIDTSNTDIKYSCEEALEEIQRIQSTNYEHTKPLETLEILFSSNIIINQCYLHNINNYRQVISNLLSFVDSLNQSMNKVIRQILNIPEFYPCLSVLFKQPENKHLIGDLLHRIWDMLNYKFDPKYNLLVDIVLENILMEYNYFNILSCYQHEYLSMKLVKVIENSTIPFDQNTLSNACSGLPITIHTVMALLNKNMSLDNSCFCPVLLCNEQDLETILALTNFPINIDHFRLVLQKQFNRYNEHNRKEQFEMSKRNKIELLITYGYIPCKADVMFAIQNKTEISNLHRFNISLDDDILQTCHESNYYPNYDFRQLSKEHYQLYQLASQENVAGLKRFHKTNPTIVPDRLCINNALKYTTNMNLLKCLTNIGGIIDFDCIKTYLNRKNVKKIRLFLFAEFDRNLKETKQKYESRIQELEQRITELEQ